jgi:hypothetical protein
MLMGKDSCWFFRFLYGQVHIASDLCSVSLLIFSILADALKEFNTLEEFQMYDAQSDIRDSYTEVIEALQFHPRLHTLNVLHRP